MVLDTVCKLFQYMKLFRGNYHKTGESKGMKMIWTINSVMYNKFAKNQKRLKEV